MMRCTQCGRKMKAKERFCSDCGAPRPAEEIRKERISSWKATLSLMLGILSLLAPLFSGIWPVAMGVLGIVSGIMAIIFAILSRKETNRQLSGMALTGIILGIFGLCISLIVLMFAIVCLLMAPFLPDFSDVTEVYNWIYANYGEDAAKTFESFMFLWE